MRSDSVIVNNSRSIEKVGRKVNTILWLVAVLLALNSILIGVSIALLLTNISYHLK